MNTGGHWPRGSHRALEGQCLDISTYMSHHTKPYISVIFLKPHLNHPGQHRVTMASLKYSNLAPDFASNTFEVFLNLSNLRCYPLQSGKRQAVTKVAQKTNRRYI